MTTLDDPVSGSGFPTPTADQWRRSVEAVLRKAGTLSEGQEATAEVIDRLLGTDTLDGVHLSPLYTPAGPPATGLPGSAPFTRGARTVGVGWDIRTPHNHPDPETAQDEILTDLDHGATSLWLRLGPSGIPVEALSTVLTGVYVDMAAVVLDAGPDTARAAGAYLDLVAERDVTPTAVHGNLGADPLAPEAAEWARRCADGLPNLRAVTVDATAGHDAGASDAWELAVSLASGVACLRSLTDAGLSVESACDQVEFRYAAGVDQFATIAKFRAARRVWQRVTESCGVPGSAQRQHAVTSRAMMTTRDPWVNMLRTTIACFAAGVAGADAVTVLPFDSAIGLSDGFARRIARNTHALLLEEAHVGRVIDPAGGSWYVEARTERLAERAWALFQDIEAAGGLPAARDMVRAGIAGTRARRTEDIHHRRLPITGVSEFPDVTGKPVVRPPAPRAGDAPAHRYAEDFEALRDRADATTPRVFLATLGPLSTHTARAMFASNLFQAGGFHPVSAGATDTTDEVVEAFRASDTDLVCVCSSDRLYAERAEATITALRGAGARRVLLAGVAPPGLESLVDESVFVGCDAVAALTRLHDAAALTRLHDAAALTRLHDAATLTRPDTVAPPGGAPNGGRG